MIDLGHALVSSSLKKIGQVKWTRDVSFTNNPVFWKIGAQKIASAFFYNMFICYNSNSVSDLTFLEQ